MIKIIKPGKVIHRATCNACECEFEYDKGDLYNIEEVVDDHGGITHMGYRWSIICPCCKTIVYLQGLHELDEK